MKKGAKSLVVKTNNLVPKTLCKNFFLFCSIFAAVSYSKRALTLKFRLNMEKQRFKSCLSLWNPLIHLWSFLKNPRIKKCRTP